MADARSQMQITDNSSRTARLPDTNRSQLPEKDAKNIILFLNTEYGVQQRVCGDLPARNSSDKNLAKPDCSSDSISAVERNSSDKNLAKPDCSSDSISAVERNSSSKNGTSPIVCWTQSVLGKEEISLEKLKTKQILDARSRDQLSVIRIRDLVSGTSEKTEKIPDADNRSQLPVSGIFP